MQATLRELLDNGLMSEDEVTELQAYLTSDPATWFLAPEALRDKAWMGLVLLEAEPPHRMH